MQDHKMAAAGERSDYAEQERMRREYVKDALEWLMMFTRTELTGEEIVRWEERLLTVPQWKLSRLTDFSRPFITEVWDFFEGMRQKPETYPPLIALPEPKSSIGKDTCAHIRRMFEFMGDDRLTPEKLAEKRRVEREGLEELNAKYPGAGFDSVLREKRFQTVP